jgi:hypothetical protein
MCLVLSSVLLCLVLSGCASAAGSGDRGRNLDPITSEQFGEAKPEGLSALQIIERFRPRWLQSMGAINAASLSVVVVDGYWHPVVQILEIVVDRAPEITLRYHASTALEPIDISALLASRYPGRLDTRRLTSINLPALSSSSRGGLNRTLQSARAPHRRKPPVSVRVLQRGRDGNS